MTECANNLKFVIYSVISSRSILIIVTHCKQGSYFQIMSDQEGLHPNWAALATTSFTFKKFVKAADTETSFLDNRPSSVTEDRMSGDAVKEFYQEILSDETLARKKLNANNSESKYETVELSDDDDVEIIDKNANYKLLVAIQNEDVSTVKKLLNCDYNCTDEYGWTALDLAAMVGNIELVKFLAGKGAQLNKWDEIRPSLVKRNIVDVISFLVDDDAPVEIIDMTEDTEVEKCEECGEMYDKNDLPSHRAKISHQLSKKNEINSKRNPGFQISEMNVGFKLMRKSGWDGASGLGDDGTGKLFPVKTIFKQDRKGLESGDRKRSRITHFGPNDVKSVENRRKRKPFNVKKVKKIVKRGSKFRQVIISKEQLLREELGSLLQ